MRDKPRENAGFIEKPFDGREYQNEKRKRQQRPTLAVECAAQREEIIDKLIQKKRAELSVGIDNQGQKDEQNRPIAFIQAENGFEGERGEIVNAARGVVAVIAAEERENGDGKLAERTEGRGERRERNGIGGDAAGGKKHRAQQKAHGKPLNALRFFSRVIHAVTSA